MCLYRGEIKQLWSQSNGQFTQVISAQQHNQVVKFSIEMTRLDCCKKLRNALAQTG